MKYVRGMAYGVIMGELAARDLWVVVVAVAFVWLTNKSIIDEIESRLDRLEGSK